MKKAVPDLDMLRSALIGEKLNPWECDKMAWAFLRRVEYPLAQYDLETWERMCREGEPEASLTSNSTSCLRVLSQRWPQNEVDIKARNGKARIEVRVKSQDIPSRVQGTFQGELALEEMSRGLAIAALDADTLARHLQARLSVVHGLADKVAPYTEWPIEVVSGSFAAVDHENRLLCAGGISAEVARDFSTMNHKGDYGLMLCRERYEKHFGKLVTDPASAPDADTPEP